MRLCLTALLIAAAVCAEDDIVIGKRNEAAADAPETIAPAGLYAASIEGGAAGIRRWQALTSAERANAIADCALNCPGPLRQRAIRELALLENERDPQGAGIVALGRLAVRDENAAMREAACRALCARSDPRILAPLAQAAIENKDAQIRQHAVDALKAIGGPPAFEIIVEHWKEVWGGSARAHTFFGRSQSYVAGYNISGSSYEPVVKSILTGEVLDVKVTKVERDVYVTVIREIAGDPKVPENPNAWDKWLDKNAPRLAEQAAARRAEIIAELKK